MRSKFEQQLIDLNNALLGMGAYIETAIGKAIEALINQNCEAAEKIIEGDNIVDDMEKEIESQCLKLLLQQQPVARDLRMISAALKMITDMERIGDHAADISEITLYLAGQKYIKKLEHIPMMAQATIKMLGESIDSYVKKDLDLANKVIEDDNIVDNLFIQVKNDLIALIHEDVENGEQAMDLLMIAKYLERIGDHAQNIAEWVVFSITGTHKTTQIL